MAGRDFLEEQRRRQRELVEARKGKQDPDSIVAPEKPAPEKLTAEQKVGNFWYYYRYVIFASLFIIAALAIIVAQCATREKFDYDVILYCRSAPFTEEQTEKIEAYLNRFGVDVDGNGEVNVRIIDCSYAAATLSDEQLARSSKLMANVSGNPKALLFITDEKTFSELDERFEGKVFVPLSDGGELFVDLPEDFYEEVNEGDSLGLTIPKGMRVSRRIADDGTTVGQDKNIEKLISAADETIRNLKTK